MYIKPPGMKGLEDQDKQKETDTTGMQHTTVTTSGSRHVSLHVPPACRLHMCLLVQRNHLLHNEAE